MFNSELPTQAQLPSTLQLLVSTLMAMLLAAVLLITTVLPAEYGIDPTGVGRVLGLTQMGEIKEQLAEEAAADRAQQAQASKTEPQKPVSAPAVAAALVSTEAAQSLPAVAAEPAPAPVMVVKTAVAATPVVEATTVVEAPVFVAKKDGLRITLRPGEPAEVKLKMSKDAVVAYRWSANGGKLNYDAHGDPYGAPKGFYHGYGKGRFQPGDQGELKAAFDGSHGWFWRNRTNQTVTLTLQVEGDFDAMNRVL